jgi:predicted small secreted protein
MKGGGMNRMILGVILLLGAATFYGCSTMKGVGDDLKVVGGWITKSSTNVEKSL